MGSRSPTVPVGVVLTVRVRKPPPPNLVASEPVINSSGRGAARRMVAHGLQAEALFDGHITGATDGVGFCRTEPGRLCGVKVLGAQFRADRLGRATHRRIASRAGVVFGQRAIRRAEPQRKSQRLAIRPDLRAGEHVEQLHVLQ
jgi:hypothetical protein